MTTKPSRRTFIQSAALAGIAGAAGTAWGAAPAAGQAGLETDKPSPLRLGLSSYSFRDFTRAQMIGYMKQLNVNSLNCKDVKDHLPADPAGEAQAMADYTAAGITVHAAGVIYFKDDDNDIRSNFEYLKRANIPVMTVGRLQPAMLPRIEKFVKEYDIRVAIHNHGPKDMYPTAFDVLKVVNGMDPRMGCCFDVGHAASAGNDGAKLVESIHAAGPRLFNMHVKDVPTAGSPTYVPVGEGILPFRDIFQALIAVQYKGYVDLEKDFGPADDPMPGTISSFSYMRGLLSGMGYANPPAQSA
jgi:hypothetical protein